MLDCLLQLAVFGGASMLVDPLALGDLSPLAPILADASVLKVVHGGDNDVTSLRRDCLTASAAPGTAGEQMAMSSLTFG